MQSEIPFYSYLTPAQQQLTDTSMQKMTYKKGQVVHHHGSSCVGLILVQKGRIAFSLLSDEGREVTLFCAEAGETCILSAACVFRAMNFSAQIMAETYTEVEILSAPVLAALMAENTEVERIVYKLAVSRFSSVTSTLQQILFLSLEKRLALFLREEASRRREVHFSVTHEQIAKYIGSSREVVTRMLNQFSARGIVSLGRGTVTIEDPKALLAVLE